MAPETRQTLHRLYKKIALTGLLLACVTFAWLYFIASVNMQLVFALLMLIGAGGTSYRYASAAPLWTGTPWLKALMCCLFGVGGALTFAAMVALGSVTYIAASGAGATGSLSRGGFSSGSFD